MLCKLKSVGDVVYLETWDLGKLSAALEHALQKRKLSYVIAPSWMMFLITNCTETALVDPKLNKTTKLQPCHIFQEHSFSIFFFNS